MKKLLCKIVTIAMLVTMFLTVFNLCTASAAPNVATKTVTKHHKQPSKPVKPIKTPKCAIPTKTPKCVKPTPIVTETLIISAGSDYSKMGGEVCVPVSFENVPANGIGTAIMKISYDPNMLIFKEGIAGDIVPDPDNNFSYGVTSPPGVIELLYYDIANLNRKICTDGILANLKFTVNSLGPATTSIKIYNMTVSDGNLANIPATAVEGYVGILETTPKPYYPSSTPTKKFMQVSVGTLDATEGDNITVPISFKDISPRGVGGFEMAIHYDPQQLEYISYEQGNIVTNPAIKFEVSNSPNGYVDLLFNRNPMETEGIYSDGVVANLNFKVISHKSDITVIDINYAILEDVRGFEWAAGINSGTVTIKPLVTPTLSSAFEITVGSKQALPKENVTIPIYFDDLPEVGLSTCDLAITYDPEQLEFLSCEAGNIVPNPDTNFAINKERDGFIEVLFLDYSMGTEYIKSGGIFANLIFKVIGSSYEVTHVNISNQVIGDVNLKLVPTEVYPGSVIIDIPLISSLENSCYKQKA